MKEILISVNKKIATAAEGQFIVNGNSDVVARFAFDSEWENSGTKTAVFLLSDGSAYYEIIKDGVCPVPVLYNTAYVKIGVISASVYTSTSAKVVCRPCITDENAGDAPVTEDNYAKLCTYIDEKAASVEISKAGNWLINGKDTGVSAKGEKGDRGIQGQKGDKGDKGDSYVLTASDKAEIAKQVEHANIVQAPRFVNSINEMTDVSKSYVLASTGRIWAHLDTTAIQTVTEQIGDTANPFIDNARLGSDGSTATGYDGYVATPYIDLLAYPVPFTLHLEGATFIPTATDSYTRICSYTAGKTKISQGNHTNTTVDSSLNVGDSDVTVNGNTATILFDETPKTNNANNDGVLQFIRFSGKGSAATAKAYVTYEAEVTGGGWVDTGTSYAPALTENEKTEIAEMAANIIDAELLSLVGNGEVTV